MWITWFPTADHCSEQQRRRKKRCECDVNKWERRWIKIRLLSLWTISTAVISDLFTACSQTDLRGFGSFKGLENKDFGWNGTNCKSGGICFWYSLVETVFDTGFRRQRASYRGGLRFYSSRRLFATFGYHVCTFEVRSMNDLRRYVSVFRIRRLCIVLIFPKRYRW